MSGRSIRKTLVLIALCAPVAVATGISLAAELPLVVKAADGQTVREFSVFSICDDASEEQGREGVPLESAASVVAASLANKCPVWIGDGTSAPALVTPRERPGVGVISLSTPAEVTVTLMDLSRATEPDEVVLSAEWRPVEDGAEWTPLPYRLMRLDRTSLPRLTIGALPAGYLDLRVHAGDTEYALPRVLLEPGGWADLGKIKPKGRFTVCGLIADWSEEMEGLEVFWAPASEGAHEQRVESFKAGLFCLPEMNDEVVWVWSDGGGWSSDPIQVRASSLGEGQIELVATRNERRFVSWFPPEVSRVELEIYGELAVGSRKYLTHLARSTVSAGGQVILPRHRPVVLVAHAMGPEHLNLAPAVERIVATNSGMRASEIELTFEPASRIYGRVTTSDEEPIDGVEVVAVFSGDATEVPLRLTAATTDPTGAYELLRLPAGEVELLAKRAGYLERRLSSALPSDSSRKLDFSLSRGERVTGIVVDKMTGNSVAGAHVQLIGHGGRSEWTRADGLFSFEGIAPGSYSIKADAPQRRQAHERLTVEQGRNPPRLRVEMTAGTRWQTRIVGYSGVPSSITILRASEHYSAPVAADGRFVLENGPDGLVGFTLFGADGHLICTGGVEVPAGSPLMNSEIACSSESNARND